jgi:hypothetical protein
MDKFDPARCDGFNLIASETDVIFIFTRKAFVPVDDANYTPEMVLSAAVSVPWQVALNIAAAVKQVQEQMKAASQPKH